MPFEGIEISSLKNLTFGKLSQKSLTINDIMTGGETLDEFPLFDVITMHEVLKLRSSNMTALNYLDFVINKFGLKLVTLPLLFAFIIENARLFGVKLNLDFLEDCYNIDLTGTMRDLIECLKLSQRSAHN